MIIREGVGTRKTNINTKMCYVALRTEQSLMSLWTSSKNKKKPAKHKKNNLCKNIITA